MKEIIIQMETDSAFPVVKTVGEFVRCKDCIHWDGKTLCNAPGSYVPRHADDFCSQAERREDGRL